MCAPYQVTLEESLTVVRDGALHPSYLTPLNLCQGHCLLVLPWLPLLGVTQHTWESALTQNCVVLFLQNAFPNSVTLVFSMNITSAPPSCCKLVSLSPSVNMCNLSPYKRLYV